MLDAGDFFTGFFAILFCFYGISFIYLARNFCQNTYLLVSTCARFTRNFECIQFEIRVRGRTFIRFKRNFQL